MKLRDAISIGVVLLALLSVASPTRAAERLEVIPLHQRAAGELLPVVRQMLGAEGTVTAYDHQLVLKAPPGELAAMKKLISELDRPRALLRIDVWQGVASAGFSEGAALDAGDEEGSIRLGNAAPEEGPGDPSGRFAYRLGNARKSTEQVLHVLDGRQALITVGKEVPFTSAFAVVAGNKSGYAEQRTLRTVTTGFWVRPRLMGNEVELDITPHLAGTAPGARALAGPPVPVPLTVPTGARWADGRPTTPPRARGAPPAPRTPRPRRLTRAWGGARDVALANSSYDLPGTHSRRRQRSSPHQACVIEMAAESVHRVHRT